MNFNNNSNLPHPHHSPNGNHPKLPEKAQIGLIIGAVIGGGIGLFVANPLGGAILGGSVGSAIGFKKS